MKKRKYFIFCAVCATLFIFYNSSQNSVKSLKASESYVITAKTVLAKLGIVINYKVLVFFVRKAAHIAEYFVQSLFISMSCNGRYRKRIIYVLFFGLFTACSDELIQLYVGRSSEVKDIFIDFFGTLIGLAVGSVIYIAGRRKKCRTQKI